MKLNLGFDFDEVIMGGALPGFIQYCKRNNIPFDEKVFAERNSFTDAMGLSRPVISDHYEDYVTREGAEDISLISHTIPEKLASLSDEFGLHLISARSKRALDNGLCAMRKSGVDPDIFETITPCHGRDKSSIIAEKKIVLFIDDNSEEIERILENTEKVNVIQFPSFLLGRTIRGPRVYQLPVHSQASNNLSPRAKEILCIHAWEQIVFTAKKILSSMTI